MLSFHFVGQSAYSFPPLLGLVSELPRSLRRWRTRNRAFRAYDVAMPQDAADKVKEAEPPEAERQHAQDKIAALEDKLADKRAQLEAAQRRELWLQGQIDQIQQRLLPPPRQGIIERIAEAMARLRRPKGSA